MQVLTDFLHWDPEKRPTAQQAQRYPYFQLNKKMSAAAISRVQFSSQRTLSITNSITSNHYSKENEKDHDIKAIVNNHNGTTNGYQNGSTIGENSSVNTNSTKNISSSTLELNSWNEKSPFLNNNNSYLRKNSPDPHSFSTLNELEKINSSVVKIPNKGSASSQNIQSDKTTTNLFFGEYSTDDNSKTNLHDSSQTNNGGQIINDKRGFQIKERVNDVYVNRSIVKETSSEQTKVKHFSLYDPQPVSSHYGGFFLHDPATFAAQENEKFINMSNNPSIDNSNDSKVYNAFSKLKFSQPGVTIESNKNQELNYMRTRAPALIVPVKPSPAIKWNANDNIEDDELALILGWEICKKKNTEFILFAIFANLNQYFAL